MFTYSVPLASTTPGPLNESNNSDEQARQRPESAGERSQTEQKGKYPQVVVICGSRNPEGDYETNAGPDCE